MLTRPCLLYELFYVSRFSSVAHALLGPGMELLVWGSNFTSRFVHCTPPLKFDPWFPTTSPSGDFSDCNPHQLYEVSFIWSFCLYLTLFSLDWNNTISVSIKPLFSQCADWCWGNWIGCCLGYSLYREWRDLDWVTFACNSGAGSYRSHQPFGDKCLRRGVFSDWPPLLCFIYAFLIPSANFGSVSAADDIREGLWLIVTQHVASIKVVTIIGIFSDCWNPSKT